MKKRRIKIKSRGEPFKSRMTQILNVDLRRFFSLVKHVMVVGASGSGKTSTLLLLTKLFYDNGEAILWRDDSSLEFFSLRKIMPLLVFVPQGCEIMYERHNVEYAEYDPWNLKTLFDHIDRERVNPVVFDLFTHDMSMFLRFWSQFFYSLYKHQRQRVKERISFVTDEINDLCPSTRRGYIPRQLALSSNIYFSMKKFRKEGIRLVVSTHTYGDIHKPVREAFQFYLFKRMDGASVPDRFKRYEKVIERLAVNEMFVVDEKKSFNVMNVSEVVKPRRITVKWKGDLEQVTEHRRKEIDAWKRKTQVLAALLTEGYNVTFEQLAEILEYKGASGAHQFLKKISDDDKEKVAALLEKLGEQG